MYKKKNHCKNDQKILEGLKCKEMVSVHRKRIKRFNIITKPKNTTLYYIKLSSDTMNIMSTATAEHRKHIGYQLQIQNFSSFYSI